MRFYTNVATWGSRILYRGIDDSGRRVHYSIKDYGPPLFTTTPQVSEFKTIHGQNLRQIPMESIKDAREFVKEHESIENFPIYGNQRYEYAFIADEFPGEIEWDQSKLLIVPLDIETGSENGFPDIATASEPVIAISMRIRDTYYVLGLKDYTYDGQEKVKYIKCQDETDLLTIFLDIWSRNYPDIVTGWNIKFFDIIYLVNRIRKILSPEHAQKISPWNIIMERQVFVMNKAHTVYVPLGIGVLDYLELYRKFSPTGTAQDSYKLDAICEKEIGEKKLSYEEYGSLHRLYRENYKKFMDYNVRDVVLIDRLEDKLKLLELALTLAYDSKSNYDDVFMQVRMWDNIVYNFLYKDKVIVPPSKVSEKDEAYVGAYVKEPKPAMYHWIASFDLNSLYPHLIMQFNISPDTFIEAEKYINIHQNILRQGISIDSLLSQRVGLDALKILGCTITPNGQFFATKEQGFLAKIMDTMYEDRSRYKKKAIEAKKELEKETDPTKRFEIEKRIARFNNLQLAKKVCLNSAYGALGNEFFRFFDVRQASAITTSGQLAIRWIENEINSFLNSLLKTSNEDYIIASDTDSIYINLDRLVRLSFGDKVATTDPSQIITFMDRVCEDRIQPFIDQSYAKLANYTNAYAQKMQMKREALVDRGIWTGKKHYILNVYDNEGVRYKEPQLKILGMEAVKSSTPSICRTKMKELMKIIMTKTEDDVLDFIDDFEEEFRKQPLADIAFPRGVNGIQKYSGRDGRMFESKTPIHVRGSIVYNHFLDKLNLNKDNPRIREGDKIRYIYLREPNQFRSDIIAFPLTYPAEFKLEKVVDYEVQFEKSFLEPMKSILDIIGWRSRRLNTLQDFFT